MYEMLIKRIMRLLGFVLSILQQYHIIKETVLQAKYSYTLGYIFLYNLRYIRILSFVV